MKLLPFQSQNKGRNPTNNINLAHYFVHAKRSAGKQIKTNSIFNQ